MRMVVLALPSGVSKALEVAEFFKELGLEVHAITKLFDEYQLRKVMTMWASLDFVVCVSSISMCVHALKDLAKMPYDPGVVAVSPRGSVAIPIMNCGIGGARALCRYMELRGIVKKCVDTSAVHEEGAVNLNELPFVLRLETIERWRRLHDLLIDIDRGRRVRVHARGRMLRTLMQLSLPKNVEIVDEPKDVDVCIVHVLESSSDLPMECGVMMRGRPVVVSVRTSSASSSRIIAEILHDLTSFFGFTTDRIDYAVADNSVTADALRNLGILNVSVVEDGDAVAMLRRRWRNVDILLNTRRNSVEIALAEIKSFM